MMTIYEKLVQLRKSKGWSQEDLVKSSMFQGRRSAGGKTGLHYRMQKICGS